MTNTMHYDVIIVGAGPGGMAATLYASRANLSVLLIEKGVPGGEMLNTAEIENYPGFSIINGPELADKMYQGAMQFGAKYTYGEVDKIDVENGVKKVYVGQTVYTANSVIVSTGAHHRKLNVPGEENFAGRGVSYCAVCDGAFFKEKVLVVVGGGDSAVEEAIYLTQYASKVIIVHRRDTLRAQKILQDRAFKNEKITFVWDSVVESINGNDCVGEVVIKNIKTNEQAVIKAEGVFIYVGMLPNSDSVKHLGITNSDGWIVTNEQMETSMPGLFAIGDVRDKILRQVVTAVGDGGIAGQQAYHYIESLEN